MTPAAAQTDECFRQRKRLPFAKEPVERNVRKALITCANGLFCVRRVFVCFQGIPLAYPYREEEIDHD